MLGKLLGLITLFAFGATIMNFVVKYINKNYRETIKNNKNLSAIFPYAIDIFVKKHKLWGTIAVVGVIAHATIQFMNFGLNISGAVAAMFMILQFILGVFVASASNDKRKFYLSIHRIVPLILCVAVVMHLIFA